MSLLDAFLVHGMRNILRQHHISKAWMRCLSPFVVVQVLEAYAATGKIMAWTILVLVQAEMSLSFQMLLSLAMADLPKISLLLISGAQLPSLVIFDPRKKNFTSSTSWPSMLIPLVSFSPVQRIFVLLMLRMLSVSQSETESIRNEDIQKTVGNIMEGKED